jgi:hypothetical protein
MKRFHHGALLAAAALGLIISEREPARADSIINNFGLASPAETLTFDSPMFPTGTPINTQYAGQGVTFSPGLFYNVQPVFFPTPSLANFDFVNVNNPVTIDFAQVQTGAAFALQTNPGTSTFTAFLNGTFVESFTAATDLSVLPDLTNASNFYGFTNIVFNQLEILSNTTFFQLDNLQLSVAPVPEPSTLVMGGLSIVLSVGYYWSRSRRTSGRAKDDSAS